VDGDADELVAQATDGDPDHGTRRARHRVPDPPFGPAVPGRQRRPPATRLGRPNGAHANRRAAADARAARTRERTILDHQPHRPDWFCTGCRQPWPCLTYREHVIHDAPTVQLVLLMTSWMTEAAGELTGSAAGDLWHRFITWARQRPA
jgi:hypothetical protein